MSQATFNERYGWQRRRVVPLPLRLVTTAATLVAVAALLFTAATARPQPSIQMTAGSGTTISILNSKEGLAVLSAGNLRPGDSATGSVTITNTGDGDGAFSLSSSALNDLPGAGAGILSGKLDLTVADSTVPTSPVTVYAGKVDSMGVVALGTYAAGEARTYDFTVFFPNGALGAENAYQGATMSVTLDWDAVLVGGAPAPAVATATPADGSTVASASSASLTTNIALAQIRGLTLDGSPLGATISGTHVTFATGGLTAGPHTIAGVLEGLDGQTTPFRIHFTTWNLAAADYPYVEMNSPAGEPIALTASNGDARLSVQANSWSGGAGGDWVVFRVDPAPAPVPSGGLAGAGDLYGMSAYWALAAGAVTSFDKPVDVRITAASSHVIPASYASGTWRRLQQIPSGTTLPSGWQDGFYVNGAQVHVLTRNAGSFGLLRDVQAPSKPRHFSSKSEGGRVVLTWRAATDNEGIEAYLVYRGGSVIKTLGRSARSSDIGRVKPRDGLAFTVSARDAAGNVGAKAGALVAVPRLTGVTLAEAKSTLRKRGLKVGKLTHVYSATVSRGHVVRAGKSGVVLVGTAVGLTVSKGAAPQQSNSSNGYSQGGDSGGPQYPTYPAPTTTTYPSYPTTSAPSPLQPSSTPSSEAAGGDPSVTPSTTATAGPSPTSYASEVDESSRGREAAGLALLAGLFLGAGALAFHARRGAWRRPEIRAEGTGQLVFWDERLIRTTLAGLRRMAQLAGR